MGIRYLLNILLFFLFAFPCTGQIIYDMPVSYSRLSRPGKPANERSRQKVIYDMGIRDSVLLIRANQIRKFPGLINGITLYSNVENQNSMRRPHFKKIARLSRSQIKNSMLRQAIHDSGDLASIDLQHNPGLDSATRAKRHFSNYKDFFDGKTTDKNIYAYQWFILAEIPLINSPGTVYMAKIRIPFSKDLFLYTDTVPAMAYPFLPQVDKATCEPVDRVFTFKKLKGYGFQNFRPVNYIPSGRKVFKKEFEIYFERNRSMVANDQIRPIIEFLENNQYSILNASVEAYASIEGPVENNYNLQQKRAALVINLLQEHNPDKISLDTVICNENWDLFYQQIKKTPFEYLDSLGADSIRVLLKDSILLVKLEPFLKYQRKGILKLTMANIFTPERINSNILEDIRWLSYSLLIPGRDKLFQSNRNKAAGILNTLENRVERGLLKKDLAERIIREINNPVLWVMYFYNSIRLHEETGKNPALFGWNEILVNAQKSNLRLFQETQISSQTDIYIKQAVDIQFYSFQYILKGLANWNIICHIDYPDDRSLYPLILNRLSFIYDNAGAYLSMIPCDVDVKEMNTILINPSDTIPYRVLRPIIDIRGYLQSRYTGYDWKEQPRWNTDPKGAYYFFLKKVFLARDESIRSFIIQPDNLYEFDLYTLLYLNVENWDPFRNFFYDEDISLVDMSKLAEMLKKIDGRICPMHKNQLYLDFHLKCLYYFKLFGNPLDREQVKAVETSVRFIGEYFTVRARFLPSEITLAVVKQLNLFSGFPGKETSVQWSYKILKEGSFKNFHTEEENRIYWQLASCYEPSFERFIQRISSSVPDICSFFSGKYRLKKWRKDLYDLYNHDCL